MMLDGLDSKCDHDIGLAVAWSDDEGDIIRAFHKHTAVQAPDQTLVDLANGKIELGQIPCKLESWGLTAVFAATVTIRRYDEL